MWVFDKGDKIETRCEEKRYRKKCATVGTSKGKRARSDDECISWMKNDLTGLLEQLELRA